MSTLAENVAKVKEAHAALKVAITEKGVTVPDGTKLSEMPALVEQISTEPIPNVSRAVFAYSKEDVIVVPRVLVVDFNSIPDISGCFYSCLSLTSLTLPDGFGQASTDLSNCFYNCRSLTSLTLPDGFGQAATNLSGIFQYCSSLTNIIGNTNFKVSFRLSYSNKLTHDSLMVVINGLQTVTTNQTLTLGSTNLAKLTDEEKKVATDKGWTLA